MATVKQTTTQPTADERKSQRNRYLRYAVIVLAVVIAVAALIGVMLVGYSADWTGFQAYTDPKGDFHPSKTLWDWMDLLIIPLVLGVGVFLLNRSEQWRQERIAQQRAETEVLLALDRTREDRLQAYLDRMQDLLEKGLKSAPESDILREVARTRTLIVLRGLDSQRNGFLLNFLHDSQLLAGDGPIVSLDRVNLSGVNLSGVNLRKSNLSCADLSGANLSEANLSGANLSGADLSGANLREADLNGANLNGANLRGGNLRKAHLSRADLNGANLRGAILSRADLSGAKLKEADLSEANLSGADLRAVNLCWTELSGTDLNRAAYNDATKWPDGFDPVRAGAEKYGPNSR